MKKFIYAVVAIVLLGSCEDELLASAYDRTPEVIEVYTDSSVNDSIEVKNIDEPVELHPIEFNVKVEDYNEQ